MTDPDYTAICLVIDRSGSMERIRTDTEGAINAFVRDQVTEGRRTIRIVTFDNTHEEFCGSTDAVDVPPFELHPRGRTALLDAMGYSIAEFGGELAGLPEHERPAHVVFAVMTDGHENSSVEYDWATVAKMVAHQESVFGWKVLYLGANQDAIAVGARLGVKPGQTMTYDASAQGTRSAVHSTSEFVSATAAGRAAEFTDDQRRDATRS